MARHGSSPSCPSSSSSLPSHPLSPPPRARAGRRTGTAAGTADNKFVVFMARLGSGAGHRGGWSRQLPRHVTLPVAASAASSGGRVRRGGGRMEEEGGYVPSDLTPEECQELENIRRRKQELLADIQVEKKKANKDVQEHRRWQNRNVWID
ncbi:uncharacterized protein LOC121082331 isoform X1 [Falco naumanni]|uniref:uncharacterized protein LOC121082331 isoform X1 n=1 Tax=Falco naumanni TaxID=148594 RepID=UPI001ADE948C|nr:uncharacterized protein LOC121082331 isoform X1 [Falco naumanni]